MRLIKGRRDASYRAHAWNGLKISPRVSRGRLDLAFWSIKERVIEHPLPKLRQLYCYVFLFHIPFILLLTLYMKFGIEDENSRNKFEFFYTRFVIVSAFVLVAYALCSRLSYRRKLKERFQEMSKVLEELNASEFARDGFRMSPGVHCAWIEAHFLSPDVQMMNTQEDPGMDLGHTYGSNENPYLTLQD